jgi:hypothetical protein
VNGTLKPVELILEREKRENNGGDEPNQDTIYHKEASYITIMN